MEEGVRLHPGSLVTYRTMWPDNLENELRILIKREIQVNIVEK